MDLDSDIPEEAHGTREDYKLWAPELEVTSQDMRRRIPEMDDPRFWL